MYMYLLPPKQILDWAWVRILHCTVYSFESVLFSLFYQQAVVKTLFLNYFYKRCIHRLMAPLMAQTAGEVVSKGQLYCLYSREKCKCFRCTVFVHLKVTGTMFDQKNLIVFYYIQEKVSSVALRISDALYGKFSNGANFCIFQTHTNCAKIRSYKSFCLRLPNSLWRGNFLSIIVLQMSL